MPDRVRGRTAFAAVLALAVGLGPAATAAAQSVSGSQLQTLAARAVDDPRALAELRAVQRVDGRPVDVGEALRGAEGPALAARLRTLAGNGRPAVPSTVDAESARRDAEAVLDGRRFKPSRVPRPLAGILTALGRWLEPVVDPVGRLWGRITASRAAQIALVVGVFAVAVLISTRLVGRRSPRALDRSRPFGLDTEGLDPDALEREATAAEDDGDLDRAVRLRFVAGVLRLDEAGAIAYRCSMTTGQLKAGLRSAPFAELAAAFDEIAYGGRRAQESDVRTARATWPRVLAEARR